MNLIIVLPILLVFIGLLINTTFGIYYRTEFSYIMVKNIILTVSLTICGILLSNILQKRYEDYKKYKKQNMTKRKFEAYIQPTTDDEFKKSDNDDEDFCHINPADMYKMNSSLK